MHASFGVVRAKNDAPSFAGPKRSINEGTSTGSRARCSSSSQVRTRTIWNRRIEMRVTFVHLFSREENDDVSLFLSVSLIPSRSRACFARSRLYLERSNRHDERVTRDSPRFKRNNRSSFVPKVYTRNARGIRGHVEAYVAAFDKHWNLALEDCFEVWTRKVKRKAPALGNFFLFFLFLVFYLSSFSSFVDSAISSRLDRAALIERPN